MAFIILKDKPYRYGKRRSEQEENLRKDGMTTVSGEQLEKLKYLEKKAGTERSFFDRRTIDKYDEPAKQCDK
jgi:hypothetical protein